MAATFDLPLIQGQDFTATFNWYVGGVFRGICEDIRTGYPTKIKCTGHGLPDVSDTPLMISDARGTENIERLNSTDLKVYKAERVDDDWFHLPINTYGSQWEQGTGAITYHKPLDLTNYTAVCHLRHRWFDDNYIVELTTENGGITLRAEDAMIQLFIDAATTATFSFKKCLYDVDLISATGTKHTPFRGQLNLIREATR